MGFSEKQVDMLLEAGFRNDGDGIIYSKGVYLYEKRSTTNCVFKTKTYIQKINRDGVSISISCSAYILLRDKDGETFPYPICQNVCYSQDFSTLTEALLWGCFYKPKTGNYV